MERRISEWVKISANVVDYPSHEFLKPYFMAEAKIITISKVVLNVYGRNT